MKKIISLLGVILVAFMATTFLSCEESDDNNNGKVTEQVVQFTCEPNDVLLQMADLTISYTDENGNTKTEKLTGSFSKRLTIKRFPAEGAFKVRAELKSYTGFAKTPELKYSFTRGTTTKNGSYSHFMIQTQDQVDALLAKINQSSWEWSFTADGISVK